MTENSNKNPEKVINFQLTPISKLLQSVSSLSDSEFNPKGMARVDITEKGFEITVRNTRTRAVGSLILKSSGLKYFHCSKPIEGKIINVAELCLLMVHASGYKDDDDDTVTILHFDGSNKLNFIHGKKPNEVYGVKMLEMDAEIERVPIIEFFCEAILSCDYLMEMIKQLEELGMPRQVLVNIEELEVTFIIKPKTWVLRYKRDQIVGTRGMEPGQVHRAFFIMPHLKAMREATSVEPCVLVCFLTEPADNVMMRFCFRELGDLVFIYKAEQIDSNYQDKKGSGSEEKESGSHGEKVSDSEVIAPQPEQPKSLAFRVGQSDKI